MISGVTWGIFGASSAQNVDMEIDGTVEGGVATALGAGIEIDGALAQITVGRTGEVFGMLGDGVWLKGSESQLINSGEITASFANAVELTRTTRSAISAPFAAAISAS